MKERAVMRGKKYKSLWFAPWEFRLTKDGQDFEVRSSDNHDWCPSNRFVYVNGERDQILADVKAHQAWVDSAGEVNAVSVSDERKYTEREVVMRERAAFVEGARRFPQFDMSAEQLAAEKYPLPKRRKVAEVGTFKYRLSLKGELEIWFAGDDWCECDDPVSAASATGIQRARAIVALNGQVWEDDS